MACVGFSDMGKPDSKRIAALEPDIKTGPRKQREKTTTHPHEQQTNKRLFPQEGPTRNLGRAPAYPFDEAGHWGSRAVKWPTAACHSCARIVERVASKGGRRGRGGGCGGRFPVEHGVLGVKGSRFPRNPSGSSGSAGRSGFPC